MKVQNMEKTMQHAPTVNTNENSASPSAAAAVVDEYLRRLMIPDPDAARELVSPELRIRFTGGREMRDPAQCAAFNAARYAWVKKRMERLDVVPGDGVTTVYSLGTLYGEWPDGTPFEGNRYVDRFTVRDGMIVGMEVWNDSAERLLTKHGITA